MAKKQIINPYVMFRPRAQGPYMQNLGGGAYGRPLSRGERQCFYVISAEIGTVDPDTIIVCFNTEHDQTSCVVDGDWTWYKNPGEAYQAPVVTGIAGSYSSTCIEAKAFNPSAEQSGATGPTDRPVFDYVPGTCRKAGQSEAECNLPAYNQRPISNNIYGPIVTRIGDIADNIVLVGFAVTPASIGGASVWQVDVNEAPVNITNREIVANSIRLTIDVSVTDADEVTVTHVPASNYSDACEAVDGRKCWKFVNMPVLNVVGVAFWNRADEGAWLLNPATGRWELA